MGYSAPCPWRPHEGLKRITRGLSRLANAPGRTGRASPHGAAARRSGAAGEGRRAWPRTPPPARPASPAAPRRSPGWPRCAPGALSAAGLCVDKRGPGERPHDRTDSWVSGGAAAGHLAKTPRKRKRPCGPSSRNLEAVSPACSPKALLSCAGVMYGSHSLLARRARARCRPAPFAKPNPTL